MSDATVTLPAAALPAPRVPVSVRPATPQDLPFIDSLQRLQTHQVGWMPTKQLEGKISAGHVLIAEEPSPQPSPGVPGEGAEPVGYCVGHDQYFKRDDVGIIYQVNVVPGRRRSLVGAALVRAMFDRAAYGCRLFCCWCAQDIEANRFWESLGFVPLAFRAGSAGRRRVHIFWQRRVRAGDTTTPYWFPAKTDAGAMREDRLVLPIPPGLRWHDEMPVPRATPQLALTDGATNGKRVPGTKCGPQTPTPRPRAAAQFGPPPGRATVVANETPSKKPARAKAPREKAKCDPKLLAAARELRDRWLEQVNAGGTFPPAAHGKYDVSRAVAGSVGGRPAVREMPPPPPARQLPPPGAAGARAA